MTFTAEHCAMLLPFADSLGLSHHEILSLAGKDSVYRDPFSLIGIDGTHFTVRYRRVPELLEGPCGIAANARVLRPFLPIN